MCIDDILDLTIVSDRHNSIIVSVANKFLHARHGFCNYRIKGNVCMQFKNTKHTERLFWKAAKMYHLRDFESVMSKITQVNGATTNYLANIGYKKWVSIHFGG